MTRLQSPSLTRDSSLQSLTGEWEVALAEISFPKSWFTIPRNTGKFTITCHLGPIDTPKYVGFLEEHRFSTPGAESCAGDT